MPFVRWRDQRPADLEDPHTGKLRMGIACPIQTMGFHGFVDEDNDPTFTILKVDARGERHLAANDANPQWVRDNRAHWGMSEQGTTPMTSDRDFSAMAQIPMSVIGREVVTLRPIHLAQGYRHVHPVRGPEFVLDGRPLAELEVVFSDESQDSYDWEDITLMTNG